MSYRRKRNFLIALMNDKQAFQIAHEQNWYRIPVKTKMVPKCVIDIECDGDTFHLDEMDVKRDKKRNNILESLGWSVLRYTTEEIIRNLGDVITQVKKAVNRNGGIQDTKNSTAYKYLDEGSPQLRLFDF